MTSHAFVHRKAILKDLPELHAFMDYPYANSSVFFWDAEKVGGADKLHFLPANGNNLFDAIMQQIEILIKCAFIDLMENN